MVVVVVEGADVVGMVAGYYTWLADFAGGEGQWLNL